MAITKSANKKLYAPASSTYYYLLEVSFTENSTTTETNKSSITVTGKLTANGISWASNYNNYLKIYWHDNNTNKDTLIATSTAFKNLSSSVSVKGTVNPTHKSDGMLSGYAKVEFVAGSSFAYIPASDNVSTANTALTNIPRASAVDSLTGTYLGDAVTVKFTPKVSGYYYIIDYKFVGSAYVGATNEVSTGTAQISKSIATDINLASQIPSSPSGDAIFRIRTYTDSAYTKLIGTETESITLKLKDTVVPTMGNPTATLVDLTAGKLGVYVKGYSKATIKMAAPSGIYGSKIVSQTISGAGQSVTGDTLSTGVLNEKGSFTFTCKATDSRGRSVIKTVSIEVIDYKSPTINLKAERCDANGNPSSSGTYLKCIVDFDFASVSLKNGIASKSCSCNSVSNTTFADNTAFILAANCNVASVYTCSATITDKVGNLVTAYAYIPTSIRITNYKKNGKGACFGGFATRDDYLETTWNFLSNKNIYAGGNLYVGYGSNGERDLYFFSEDGTRKSYIYGGNSSSTNSIGAYDSNDGSIWSYDCVNKIFKINKRVNIYGEAYAGTNATLRLTHTDEVYMTIDRPANTVLAAPNGSNGIATFRKLVAADLPDSGWIDCALSSNFKNYNTDANRRLRYRKVGSIVNIVGDVAPNITIAGGTTQYTIAILPAGYRPRNLVTTVQQGSSHSTWMCDVTTTGEIRFGRYRQGAAYVGVDTTIWLPINITFMVP